MGSHRNRTIILWIILIVGLSAIFGVSALFGFLGTGLAYLSLGFGIMFFVFAARYYIATVAVLVSPNVIPTSAPPVLKDTNGKEKPPMVSVHIALYNEERVVDRLLTACSKLDYPNYEVVVVDDSNDGTVGVLKDWIMKQLSEKKPKFKIIHRANREGFKGGALNEALKKMDPRAEYVVVFDADFVPTPDTLNKFLTYFAKHGPNGNGNGADGRSGRYGNGRLAAVQGYQWHTLNRTENWLTRGVSCEFSGNYMVDRTFQEVMGTLKMVAGAVYMIRADLLKQYRWSGSLTEDWEITLRLYADGYKVLYTPLIQSPAECPSNLAKLVRQRMRWAEGHTYNVKRQFLKVMLSSKVGIREKLEFLYFAPYYLQSLFLILGTAFWLTSDVLLATKLSFWTASFGWGLVFTNLLALPIMSLTGLFLEKRTRKDFPGILSQVLLTYALSPYQGFAALKGLVEPVEGSWVRTFKSGKLAGFPGRLEPRKVIKEMLPPRRVMRPPP
ncbi:MAG: glycosyltransferase family 2 protein, partial [Thaumarchaeota archaeon]|nr:glycosyltransferase family 2 protein [Nitrososphaerota archaeon]